jgi:hypothetical protein
MGYLFFLSTLDLGHTWGPPPSIEKRKNFSLSPFPSLPKTQKKEKISCINCISSLLSACLKFLLWVNTPS